MEFIDIIMEKFEFSTQPRKEEDGKDREDMLKKGKGRKTSPFLSHRKQRRRPKKGLLPYQ